MKRAIREYWKWVTAILFLALLAIISGTFILINQRLKLPGQSRYSLFADLPAATGLAPGLGQPVNVAGVKVGQMNGVKISGGVARIQLEMNPHDLPHVYKDARAVLEERTPLKDMELEISPGDPKSGVMPEGGVIPLANTEPPVDSDELTNALDADTRDYFDLLINDSARGFAGRGDDVNRLFKLFVPTAREIHEVTSALASRRLELKRLVGNLRVLSEAAATKDVEIGQVIDQANRTLQAVAGQDVELQSTLTKLPNTLTTLQSSLNDVADFGEELGPVLDGLLPTLHKLPAALHNVDPLLIKSEPVLRTKLRPLVRESRPLLRDLNPTTQSLNAVTPSLTSAFQVLNYVVNETAYNPPGDNEGFLYWTAWFAHDAASMLSTEDAQGAVIRGLALVDCDTLNAVPAIAPLTETLFGAVTACQSGG
ncbi:MAG: phospholipid/cholesterol/gamma-HCH transport system substrate-binding protein [Solirubrobacteraceae bacterium]|jgi:phospholipid/cholesterol/gamma-HCH transport system substrate-binding protein|nr:phospholipid/cholesterol/gamma-HCH transport system substrate-binding protein [Solirubrobacteraceae bacterium]